MISVESIDAVLPQTQCGECGFSGCFPYAEALARGTVSIDRCPPGGLTTVKALAELLALDPAASLETAAAKTRAPAVALIHEAECIGCTKCIQACPVDAIIGSAKRMHSILKTECTGCGLCVEPCPVDCIELVTIPKASYDKSIARRRYNNRQTRLLREDQEKQRLYREKQILSSKAKDALQDRKAKQNYIQEALARVKEKKK